VPHVVELTHAFPESLLNETFVAMQDRHPTVRLGSYPGRPMIVRLSGPESEVEAAAALVRGALAELTAIGAGPDATA